LNVAAASVRASFAVGARTTAKLSQELAAHSGLLTPPGVGSSFQIGISKFDHGSSDSIVTKL
jgi:hypothetical protein